MNSSNIDIYEFPTNLGLRKSESETEPGVKKLPEWLRRHGLHEKVEPRRIFILSPPEYSMDQDRESGVLNSDKIISYAVQQSRLLNEHWNDSVFPIILGGDCSILIGSSIALKRRGSYGLFFLDGHTDYIGPDISSTGGAAGMDLAIVTGHGHDKLTNISGQKPYFAEKNVFCVGNREYDRDYVQPILDSQIEYLDLQRLRSNGLNRTAQRFLDYIEERKLEGFFIHLDVDVLNDSIMPAVDSREKGGLTYIEFSELLGPLLASKKAIGIEITILDPDLDIDGKYSTEFVKRFIEILEFGKAVG